MRTGTLQTRAFLALLFPLLGRSGTATPFYDLHVLGRIPPPYSCPQTICQRLEAFDNALPDLRLDSSVVAYTALVLLESGQRFHHLIAQSRDLVPLATSLIPVIQTM